MPAQPIRTVPQIVEHALAHHKGRPMFQVAFDLQNFALSELFTTDGRYRVQDGNRVEWRTLYGNNGSFQMVALGQVTPRVVQNHFSLGYEHWCLAECKATWDVRIAQTMGKSALADYIKGEYFAAMKSAAEGIEAQIVGSPYNSADVKNANGLSWSLCMTDAGTVDFKGGFNGRTARFGDGSTTNTIHGINRSTTPMACNRNCNRLARLDMDLLDSIAYNLKFCAFKPPKNVREYMDPKKTRHVVLWDLEDDADYERLCNQTGATQKTGGGLRRFYSDNAPTDFRGVQVIGVAKLNGRAHKPIYIPDMAHQFMFVKEGWWMKNNPPMNDVDQIHLYTKQWDFQFNMANENPRTSIVFNTPIAA